MPNKPSQHAHALFAAFYVILSVRKPVAVSGAVIRLKKNMKIKPSHHAHTLFAVFS